MIRKTSEVHIICTLLSKEVFPDVWSLPHEVCVSCPLKKNETPNVLITLLFCHEFRATSNNSSLIHYISIMILVPYLTVAKVSKKNYNILLI